MGQERELQWEKLVAGRFARKLLSPGTDAPRMLVATEEEDQWQFAHDTFSPTAFFKKTFIHAAKYAKMEKTKAKDEWEVLVQVVGFVTPGLLMDADIAERLAAMLCAVWSNSTRWASLCSTFFVKLSQAAALCSKQNGNSQSGVGSGGSAPPPPPRQVLISFSLKCPHEYFLPATTKKEWLVSLLRAASQAGGLPDSKTLFLLFEAHGAGSADDLVDLIHASGVAEICEETERLLFGKLLPTWLVAEGDKSGRAMRPQLRAAPRPPLEQVRLLLTCRFKARSSLQDPQRRSECVEWGGAEFWEELERECAGNGRDSEVQEYAMLSEFDGALETEAVVAAETSARSKHALCLEDSVYRCFGDEGERVVLAFLETASARDLLRVFEEADEPAHVASFLCGGSEDLLLRAWRPQQCAVDEVADMVQLLVEHVPQLWSRCAQMVWSHPSLEVTEANSALVQRLLLKRVPVLDLIPRRWWHCLDVAQVTRHSVATLKDESPVIRLVQADIPIELSDVQPFFQDASLSAATQALLLDRYAASDARALATFLPLFVGNIVPYMERLFHLLDTDAATMQYLVASGDGVAPEEKYDSGWNKVLNVLLTGLRVRCRDEKNWLHSEEQLFLFTYCCEKRAPNERTEESDAVVLSLAQSPAGKWLLNQTNATVLGDLLETKCVDPLHISQVVNYLLSGGRHHVVRDAALRAMMRLNANERHVLIDKLLTSMHRLPLQVLFTLAVTQLHDEAVPLVMRRVHELAADELGDFLNLIRDANPSAATYVHTFPRKPALQDALCERFLRRYVAGDTLDSKGGAGGRRRVDILNSALCSAFIW